MLNTEQLLDRFWANYPAPSPHERQSLTDWAVELADDEILERVLDPSCHPKSSNGSVPKPNLGTLKELARDLKRECRAIRSPDESDCFYCEGSGVIHAIDKRMPNWYSVVVGRCKHCQAGEKGSAWLNPTESKPNIIEFAKTNQVGCVYAVKMMIDSHDTQLEETPNMDKDVPF